MTGTGCPIQACLKACLLPTVAVFIFMFAFDWLYHGHLLMSMYEQTASVWRPMEEMQQFMVYCLFYHAALALVFAVSYGCYLKKTAMCATLPEGAEKAACPQKRGLCYGLVVGLIMGLNHSSAYIHLPIPLELALAWFAGSVLQGLGIGLVLSYTYCTKKGCTPA